MQTNSIRNFLGIFYLGVTALLGAYILLFQETRFLPIARDDASSSFQIIIPTFIAQLTIIFKWFANPPQSAGEEINLPKWVVIAPPILTLIILLSSISLIVIDNGTSLRGGEIFKNIVTFSVSILGATTIFIIARVFQEPKKQATAP
jgi:hypothetical protein